MAWDFKAKIAALEAELKISANQMALQAGLGNGFFKYPLSQNEDPSQDKTEKFLKFWEIKTEWWKTGKGEIFSRKVTPAMGLFWGKTN
jgi:hypothetical protein